MHPNADKKSTLTKRVTLVFFSAKNRDRVAELRITRSTKPRRKSHVPYRIANLPLKSQLTGLYGRMIPQIKALVISESNLHSFLRFDHFKWPKRPF